MGSDAGMFAGGTYDEDDKEADRVWDSIDNFMDERRRVRHGYDFANALSVLCAQWTLLLVHSSAIVGCFELLAAL